MSYPLFIPPEQFLKKNSPREWTKKEAKEYLAWFLSIRGKRIDHFMQFMEVTGFPAKEADWKNISDRFYEYIVTPQFSGVENYKDPFTGEPKTRKILTNEGFALGGDMGLFVFTAIEKNKRAVLNWQLGKGPKGFASHNLPVVMDKKEFQLDPMDSGISRSQSILNDPSYRYRWFNEYIGVYEDL